ncbi:MAG TPA: division/cell wall cluster transcriptional repressor MraZ [Candidatus Hydrogenedentes bacterium]|nr:division/cell wall cluster transcriptional repressor MraZ [Candidatus Hydrogenedentota bacterium]
MSIAESTGSTAEQGKYSGESTASLDDKGRMNIPMQFRMVMEVFDHDTWYCTRGWDNSIFLFDSKKWGELLKEMDMSSTLDPEMMDFRRFFIGGVAKVRRDNQGRIPLPQALREYAGIDREAVIIGVIDHLQVWSKETWRAYQARQAEQYKAMAVRLFGRKTGQIAATEGDAQGA